MLERGLVKLVEIISAQVDQIEVENSAKCISIDPLDSRVPHDQLLDVVRSVESIRVDLLDEGVRYVQILAVGETTEGVCCQMLGMNTVQVDMVDKGRRDERVALDELDWRLLVIEREEEIGDVAQAVEGVGANALDRIADEVNDLDGAAHAEYVAVDDAELVGAQRQVVEVAQAAERVRVQLVQARVVGDYEDLEVGQVAEGEHADPGEQLAVRDHYCLQASQSLVFSIHQKH